MFFEKENPITKNPSLRASIRDGMTSAVAIGTADSYLVPFGIFLKATTLQIGLLASLPQFIGAIAQIIGAWISDHIISRRTFLVGAACCNAMVWLSIALLSLTPENCGERMPVLLILAGIYQITLNLASPVWNSLIGDLVPHEQRGRFFGLRNQWLGFISFITLVTCGWILDFSKGLGIARYGFLSIFLLAGISRLSAAYWLANHADPPFSRSEGDRFSFIQFLSRMPHSNFAKFVLFVATMQFSVAVAGPYFSLYWLNDLKLSYTSFTIIITSQAIAQFLSMKSWGGLSDKYGNRKILKVCSYGIASIPFFWLFSQNFYYMVAVQIYSGVFWAGFNLAAGNFLFDAVTPPKRARCAAYQAVVTGALILTGSICGGCLVKILPTTINIFNWTWAPLSKLLILFLISGLMRFLFASLLLKQFHEVKNVERISSLRLLDAFSGLRIIDSVTDYWVNLFRDQEGQNGKNGDEP